MRVRVERKTVAFLVLIFAASGLFAQSIPNWPAPATWSPTRSHGGLGTQDLTNPLPFIALAPCRIVDTRGGAPITGGIFTGGSDVRNYAVSGICGIPASARALSLNFTVTGPGQTTAGFLLAWPTGGAVPPVSILNWDHVPAQVANAAVVPTNASVSFTVNVSAPTHVIIDVNGYYTAGDLASGEALFLAGSLPSATIVGINHSATGGTTSGVGGQVDGAGNFGSGVLGLQLSSTGVNYGVTGVNASGTGSATGVLGIATATTGSVYGVVGESDSTSVGTAGVFGNDYTGRVVGGAGVSLPAGVRGESRTLTGVVGLVGSPSAFGAGVVGLLVSTNGGIPAAGYLGTVFGVASDSTGAPWGVFAEGKIGATGTKHFVEPHPTDPNAVILYASLEGREVGTYFRGTAKTVGGVATIQIPEDFRIVTADEGLTTQLTPIGSAATMYIVSEDLDTIVVRSSRDVTFHYLVHGLRRAFKDFQPLVKGYEFMPRSPEETMPLYLTEEARRRLIANGTYNPDGTVNMSTAERAGWTKIWADRQAAMEAARRASQQKAVPAGFNKP